MMRLYHIRVYLISLLCLTPLMTYADVNDTTVYKNTQKSTALTFSVAYIPVFKLFGDKEEYYDNIGGDDFTELTLDTGDGFSFKMELELLSENRKSSPIRLYLGYTRITALTKNTEYNPHEYQSLTGGLSFYGDQYFNHFSGLYIKGNIGLGGSSIRARGNATAMTSELGLEVGVSLYNMFLIGLGGQYHLVGYPTETMADGVGLYFNLSLRL